MIGSTTRWIQRFLYVAGFLILGYIGADWLNSRLRQERGSRELDRVLNHTPSYPAALPVPAARVPGGGLIGKVEISRVNLSAVVFQGTESSVLDHGVGHLDGSAMPGEVGNVVLAAHRDTFFRNLRDVHRGDVIKVSTESGQRTYEVASTEVVDPTQTDVADATPNPTLTLITCYPFYYVGNAPKRFIVRARDMQAETIQEPQILAKRKETARIPALVKEAPAEQEQAPSRLTPEEAANLTYVFKASP
jgi:sortase A